MGLSNFSALLRRIRVFISIQRRSAGGALAALRRRGSSFYRKRRLLPYAAALLIAAALLLMLRNHAEAPADAAPSAPRATPGPVAVRPSPSTTYPALQDPVPALLDLSELSILLDSSLSQINEPTPLGGMILYSGGSGPIDEPVLTSLYLYDMDTGAETEIAKTQIRFGEIYEGRIHDRWIVWLDTDQRGENLIYKMDRRTGQIAQVSKSRFIRPQLRLYGDNLVWMEQVGPDEDRLFLYNFLSGEPVILESFGSTSYGRSPPSIHGDVVVWVYPHPTQEGASIIKRLDLKEALTISAPTPVPPAAGSDDPDAVSIIVLPSEDAEGLEDVDYGADPEIIDPEGFAMYPVTNGRAVAWLDHLRPALAQLKLKVEDGPILSVAEGVGRIFGLGDNFVVYMQHDEIFLYFWERNQYARLSPEGMQARLSDACVFGSIVVWFEADNMGRGRDIVRISIIPPL